MCRSAIETASERLTLVRSRPRKSIRFFKSTFSRPDRYPGEKKSFVAGLAPVPLVIEPGELDAIRQTFDLEGYYVRAHELDAAYRHADRRIGEIQNLLKDLEPYESLAIHVGDLAKTRRTRVLFGEMLPAALAATQTDANAPGTLTVERLYEGQYYREGAHSRLKGRIIPRSRCRCLPRLPWRTNRAPARRWRATDSVKCRCRTCREPFATGSAN